MRKTAKKNQDEIDLGDRLIGVFFVLIFYVPTAFLIWFYINRWSTGDTLNLSSGVFWLSVAVAAVIGFLSPNLLINILGKLWAFLVRFAKFWW